MADLGILTLGVQINEADLQASVNRAQNYVQQQSKATKLPELKVLVNDSRLFDLNKHFALKQKDYGALVQNYKQNPLKVYTDLSAFPIFDAQLKSLTTQVQNVRKDLIKPLVLDINTKAFQPAHQQLNSFANHYKQVSDQLNSDLMLQTLSKMQAKGGVVKIAVTHRDDRKIDSNKELVRELNAVTKAVRENKQTAFKSVTTGIFESFGTQLSAGIQSGLRKNFNLDFRKIGQDRTNALAKPVKAILFENDELKGSIDSAGKKLEVRFRQASYRFGDAIVEALDSQGTTISQKLKIIFSKSVIGSDFKKNFQETINDLKPEALSGARAIVAGKYQREKIQNFGNKLGLSRQEALQERAVPLVQKRSAEILSQEKARNSALSVNEDTKQLFITVGGYAGTEGRSGAMLARRLKQDKQLPEGSQVISVRNTDSDVSESSINSKPNALLAKLGLGLGGEWVAEVAKSLVKPNLRGYSSDAIEVASQALVAKQQNPEVTIKILGESGGGFVAEEAAKILELLGVKDVEFLGVGTPNFMGGLNAKGNKVISPDESLGLLSNVASRYGLSNASSESQQVLGVKEHPLKFYREANVAELENFLYGKPKPMSGEQIANLKKQATEDSKTNFGLMSQKELEQTSDAALDNYQYLRRFLVDSSDETSSELVEIAEIYKSIYLKTAKEPDAFKSVRAKLKQASALYARLASDPSLESKSRADQITKDLKKSYQEFLIETTKFDGTLYEYVGTQAEKRDLLLKDLDSTISKFEETNFLVKAPAEVRTPVNLEPERGELAIVEQETKSIAMKAVELVTTPILNGLKNAGETIQESIEDFIVNRINDQLMRVPGQTNVLDPSRQIGAVDELRAKDLFKLARLGTGDIARGGLGAAAKAYSVARGTENVLMAAVPPLAIAKGVTQKVGLPMAAFTAAGMLPGVGAAESAATGLTESLLAVPAEQLASAMSGAFGEAVLQTIGNLPLIGGKLAPALAEAITQLLTHSAQLAAGGAAEVITPIVGGQIMLGAGGQLAKAALPELSPEQIQSNKQLQASTEARMKQLQSGMEYVKAMLPVNKTEATKYLARMQKEYPELSAGIDENLKALPPSQRMAEGSELAGLKGNITIAQKALLDAEKKVNAFAALAISIKNSIDKFIETSSQASNLIDAEFVEVSEPKALPSSKDRLQRQLDLIIDNAVQQVKDIGNEFSRQSKSLNNASLPEETKALIAASLDQLAEDSKNAINEVVQAFGKQTPSELKKAASSAKQKITKAENKASGTLENARGSGIAIPEGLNDGIESRLDTLKQTGQSMAQVVILAAENELEIRSPSRVFMRIGQMVVAGYKRGLEGLDNVQKVVAQSLKPDDFQVLNQQFATANSDPDQEYAALKTAERLRYKMQMAANQPQQKQSNDLLSVFERKVGLAEGSVKNFGQTVKTAFLGFAGFTGLQAALGVLDQISRATLQAARDFGTLSTRIKNFSTSPSQGNQNKNFVLDEARRLRLDPLQSMESFASLSATTTNTQYEGEFTQDLFSSINQLAKVRGANKTEVAAANRAIIQMITKGEQVYAEELIGQLSEAIPGVTSLAARGLNMDVGQMRAQLTAGNIKTSEFLPALLNQANIESGLQIGNTVETSQAKLDEFNNSITEFQIAFGQLALPVEDLRLDLLSSLLQFATDNLTTFINVAVAASGALLLQTLFPNGILTTVNSLTKSLSLSGISLANLVTGTKTATLALRTMVTTITPFIAKMALVSAVISIFQTVGDVFKDQGAEIRKFADSSIDNLDHYLEALGKVTEGQKELTKFQKFTQGRSFLEQNFVGQTIGKGSSRFLEGLFTDGALLQNAYKYVTGTRGESGFERQRRSQMNSALDVQLDAGRETISTVRGITKTGTNEESEALKELLEIEKELAKIQAKRRNLPSGDNKERRDYDNQIATLLQRQSQAREPLGILQTTLASDIEQYKSTLAILEDERNQPSISSDRQAELDKQIEKVKKQLDKANTAQDQLNKKLKDAIPSAKQLERAFTLIANQLQDQNVLTQLQASKQQEALANLQLAANISPGASQFLNDLQQQVTLTEQIKNNQVAIAETQKQLQSTAVTEALAAFELNTDITQLSPGDIEKALSERTSETPEREVLETTLGQVRNLQQLQLDTQNLQTQVAQGRVQAQESLKQSNREIAEYFKSITRETQQVALAAKQSNLEVSMIETKNKLTQGLKGAGNRFLGSFVDNLLSIVDKLFEPLQNKLDLEGQLQGFQNQFADTLQQGRDVSRGAYGGGSTVQFQGIQVTDAVDSSGEPGLDYVVSNGERGSQFGALASGEVIEIREDDRELGTGGERGYGNTVIVRTLDQATGEVVDMLYAHLDDIMVGVGQRVNVGTVLGTQGQTGSTTGAHVSVDFFGKDSNSGTPASLAMRDRVAATLATNPDSLNQLIQSSVGQAIGGGLQTTSTASVNQSNVDINRLREAIAGQESGGDYGAVNPDSGALGRYQVMPENVPYWSEKYLGQSMSPDAFLANPQMQDQLVNAVMQDMLDRAMESSGGDSTTAIRRVAAEWYSGQPDLYNNTTPQTYGAGSYPSIDEYTRSIANRYGQNPTTGSNVANTGLIQQGNQLAGQNLQTQIESATNLARSRDAQAAIELDQLVQKTNTESRQRREQLEDTERQRQRDQEDRLYETQVKTPEVEFQRQQTQNLRSFDDQTLQMQRDIRDLEEMITTAEQVRERLISIPEFATILPQILPGIDEEIAASKDALNVLKEDYAEERNIFEAQEKFLSEQYQRQEKQRRLNAKQREIGIDNQLLGILAESERRSGRGNQAITFEGIAQRQQIELDYESNLAELEELEYQGQITADEFERLKDTLGEIRDTSLENLTSQLREQQNELQRSSFSQLFDSKQNLGQGILQGYSNFGLQNPDLERSLAISQQQFNFENQIAEIDRAVASGQLLAETAAGIKTNLEALNQVQLQNINTQFNPLTQGLQYVQQGFSQLTSNLLTSSGSIQDVLTSMMNNFANFAAQMLTNELFGFILGEFGAVGGGLLGGKQKGTAFASPTASTGGSSTADWVGTAGNLLMSVFAGGFNEGGTVPYLSSAPQARQGNNPISAALRREGSGSVLATLLPGEHVLTREEAALYRQLQSSNILSFRNGGTVGNFSIDPQLTSSKQYNVNVPVTYGGSGTPTQEDEMMMQKLGENIRKAVTLEIKNQAKPGALLDHTFRRK